MIKADTSILRTKPVRLLVVVCAVFLPAILEAQTTSTTAPATTPYATLRGVVVDSVRGGVLRAASVGVLGPARMALTDSLGRFSIDSIPPGEHRIALFDDLLDSLGITVVTPPTRFSAGDTVRLALAIPSRGTIVGVRCGAAVTDGDPAALFGMVFSADNGLPAADAEVRLEWLEVEIDEATGVRTMPHSRTARTDLAGRYEICGVPAGLNAEVSARRGGDSTASVPIAFGDSPLGFATLFIPASGAESRVGAPVRGRVVDADNNPIADATVMLSSSPTAVTTESNGGFEIAAHSLGTQSVLVRKLGYEPVEVVVDVLPRPAAAVTVRLDRFVPILESAVIEARYKAGLERVGFARRREYGLGRYYEAKDLEHVTNLDNFFKTIQILNRGMVSSVPGAGPAGNPPRDVRDLGPTGTTRTNTRPPPRTSSRGYDEAETATCRTTYVDGVQVEGTEFIKPNEVVAIEIYTPSMTPSEFRALYRTCTTVVIWTGWKVSRAQVRR